MKINDRETWANRIEENDFEIVPIGKRSRRIKFRLGKSDISKKRDFLKELFQVSYNERTS